MITGAASGIGAAISRRYALEGASVALVDRNGEGVSGLADEIRATGSDAIPIRADLAIAADSLRSVEEAVRSLGGVDVLVNCAGVGQRPKPVEETSDAEFDHIFAINVRGVFLMTRAALPYLERSHEAVIVNIASNISIRPRPGYAAYTASKGAVATSHPWRDRRNRPTRPTRPAKGRLQPSPGAWHSSWRRGTSGSSLYAPRRLTRRCWWSSWTARTLRRAGPRSPRRYPWVVSCSRTRWPPSQPGPRRRTPAWLPES